MKTSIVLRRVAVLLLGGLMLMFALKQSKKMRNKTTEPTEKQKMMKKMSKKPKKADTFKVKPATYTPSIEVRGEAKASRTIAITPQLSGKLLRGNREFKAGVVFKKGQRIFSVEQTSMKLNLISQKSNFYRMINSIIPEMSIDFPKDVKKWESYLLNFNEKKNLKLLPKLRNDREKRYISNRSIISTYYSIKSAEDNLKKANFYAPFTGTLISTTTSTGTVVTAFKPIGTFVSSAKYEVTLAVPSSKIKFVSVGDTVNLSDLESEKNFFGTVTRVNRVINSASRSVEVFVTVKSDNLRIGSFLESTIYGDEIREVVTFPAKYLKEGNFVIVKNRDKRVSKAVEVISRDENGMVIVKGLPINSVVVR